MREQLRDVGIELVLEPKDYSVWMEGAHLKWDFDLSMGSYQTGPDPGHRGVAALHHQEHSEADGPQPDGLQQTRRWTNCSTRGEGEIDQAEARQALP